MKGQIKKVRKISLWKYPSKLDKRPLLSVVVELIPKLGLPTYMNHEIQQAFHRNISLSANFLFSKGEHAVPSINNRKDKFFISFGASQSTTYLYLPLRKTRPRLLMQTKNQFKMIFLYFFLGWNKCFYCAFRNSTKYETNIPSISRQKTQ